MTHRTLPAGALLLPVLAAAFGLTACGGGSTETARAKKAETPAAAQQATAQPTARPAGELRYQAILAKADAADGTVDHVVASCASCSLGMDGHAEHAVQLEGYTLHACSAACARRIKEEPEVVMTSVSFTFDED
jgi:hypothetical protein